MAVSTAPARSLLWAAAAIAATVFLCFDGAAALQASGGARRITNADFVRQSCSYTLYSSLCYATLAPYADAVARDPIRLAVVATNASLARVRSVASHVSSLLHGHGGRQLDKRTAAALRDCEETLGIAAHDTKQTTGELARLPSAKGTDVAWLVRNCQTWLSAVLADINTCVDGFSGAASGSAVKADVTRRAQKAEQYTGNALALVNLLVGPNS